MDFIRWSIQKPVALAVGVLIVVMFGLIGLTAIPVQLTPTVDRPVVTVTTVWPGRSPQEVVDEIAKPQEEELKNVGNLKKMQSVSNTGESIVTLEFTVGASIPRALQEVSDALRRVADYPDEVEEPRVEAADGASGPSNAIAWIIIDLPEEKIADHPGFDLTTLYDALDKEVKPYLERIEGVAEINIYGGREREVQVQLDPVALAQRGLNHVDVVQSLRAQNRNVSAGTSAESKRDYRVRLVGEFTTPEQVLETVVAYRDGRPVFVRDIGTVVIDHQKMRGFVRTFGHPAIAMNAIRQSGANVVEVMEQLRDRLAEVRTEILPNLGGYTVLPDGTRRPVGPDLRLRQVYDETTYIDAARGLVINNLYVGGALAGVVLMLFLRALRPTLVVMLAIPISVIGTFLVMLAMGRTLNVISLAGLAFATGMVVDNGIVVLENIYRRVQLGESPVQAAYHGAKEVWGAVLASTLTTVAVFIPVLTIQEEAGQLFRDISLAVAAAVSLSLIVSISVVPSLAARLVKSNAGKQPGPISRAITSLFGLVPLLARFNAWLGSAIHWVITGWRGWTVRPAMIVLFTVASLLAARALAPPLDYLPAGNRNLVFGGLLIPPGLSVDEQRRIAQTIEAQVKPYFNADITDEQSVASLGPIPRFSFDPTAPALKPFDPVPIENFFIGAFGGGMFVGATSQDEQVVIPVGQLLSNSMISIPDAFGGASQASLFSGGLEGGNTINLEVSGPRLDRVIAAAAFMFNASAQQYGYADVRPDPANFLLREQELQVRVNQRGRELGLTTEAVGVVIRGLFDGAFVGDYKLDGDTVDLVVLPAGGRLDFKEQLASVPVTTPTGHTVPVDSVVDFVPTLAQQQIKRVEELESVSIQVQPPKDKTIDEVMAWLNQNVVEPARAQGLIDRTMRVRMEGTAAKLDEVRLAMFGASGGQSGLELPPLIRRGFQIATLALVALGLVVGIVTLVRAKARRIPGGAYALAGSVLATAALGAVLLALGEAPQLLMARMVWALLVTYLLMAALFEKWVEPLVIMFSVPLAVVGGFAGLRLVHDWTMRNPTIAPQNLDVITMLGFVILIGTVVNNAILLVHQAMNFMKGEDDGGLKIPPMEPHRAIAESVRTRVRPIAMTVCTTVGGMAPLVLFPGAGSEMYRGLGSVVLGGLIVSTVFTLVLVPLLFSLVQDMRSAFRAAWAGGAQARLTFPVPATRE